MNIPKDKIELYNAIYDDDYELINELMQKFF